MKCPHCGLLSPDTAQRCDCGYDFHTHRMEQSYLASRASTTGGVRRKAPTFVQVSLITLSAAFMFFGGWLCTGGAQGDLHALAIGALALCIGVALLITVLAIRANRRARSETSSRGADTPTQRATPKDASPSTDHDPREGD